MRLSYDGSRKGDLPVMHPIPKFSHFLLARFADEVYSSDLIRITTPFACICKTTCTSSESKRTRLGGSTWPHTSRRTPARSKTLARMPAVDGIVLCTAAFIRSLIVKPRSDRGSSFQQSSFLSRTKPRSYKRMLPSAESRRGD
ncbi:hypothetical protein FQA47_004238 [Oryzias melastigma]|uniref:Uncharacterized protein n=1 Tax=Oryzias melastigma TaxID=30732 RepID=A0A834CT58_ORYME|nr:hypothetical protein FQA47_004238 [Oryzias melastigma]